MHDYDVVLFYVAHPGAHRDHACHALVSEQIRQAFIFGFGAVDLAELRSADPGIENLDQRLPGFQRGRQFELCYDERFTQLDQDRRPSLGGQRRLLSQSR